MEREREIHIMCIYIYIYIFLGYEMSKLLRQMGGATY